MMVMACCAMKAPSRPPTPADCDRGLSARGSPMAASPAADAMRVCSSLCFSAWISHGATFGSRVLPRVVAAEAE